MKVLWSDELHTILQQDDFQSWWQSMLALWERLDSVQARYDELLTQVSLMEFKAEFTQKKAIEELYSAGEWEDAAALLLAEASEIENKSYEAVANFENQRIMVSDLSSKIDAVEHRLLLVEAEVQKLRTSLSENKINAGRTEAEKILKKKEAETKNLNKELEKYQKNAGNSNRRKASLWEEVEQLWARSLDASLRVSEHRIKSKRVRTKAERLFKEAEKFRLAAEESKKDAKVVDQEKRELRRALENSRQSGKNLFGCLIGEDFLYWASKKSSKEVYCVPLRNQPEGYNIELCARKIYLIDRQRGVEFIQILPTSEKFDDEEQDERLGSFFSGVKKKKWSRNRNRFGLV